MAAYVLSANPNVVFNPTRDILSIDTVTSSKLNLAQVGSNVVVTDGIGHTATLQNVLLQQLQNQVAPSNIINTVDGSFILVGDDTVATATDDGPNDAPPLQGSAGNDYLRGLGGNDTLVGLAGHDLIYGNQGDDTVIGGLAAAGNDTIFGGQGNDTVGYFLVTTGNELIYGNLGNDLLAGGAGNDTIFGGQGDDTVNEFGGNNLIYGNLGLDRINAGAGNDTIWGGDGEDTINAAAGRNLIYGNQGDDNVFSFTGSNDTVFGGQGQDNISYTNANLAADKVLIYGNLGNDALVGTAGNDTIFGGQGNDLIAGDGITGAVVLQATGHADVMTGGLGNDTFSERTDDNFAIPTTSGVTTATADQITDFLSGTDKIRSFLNGNAGANDFPGNTTNYREFVDVAVTTVEQAVTRYQQASNTAATYTFISGVTDGYLVIDSNGAPGALTPDKLTDGVIVLKGLTTLAGFDFSDII